MKIMKLDKNVSWSYEKVDKKIPSKKSKTLSRDKNHQLLLTDIGGAWYLTHLEACHFIFGIMKTKSSLMGVYLVVVCNLI